MKAVILAGGLGTRLAEETETRPKPMVEIGGLPVLWHIMKIYAAHGVEDFVVCCGHKGYAIKEYFRNYAMHMSDIVVDLRAKKTEVLSSRAENWRIALIDTGEQTQTGGRLARVAEHLHGLDYFHFTYGDGVGDVDIAALQQFHQKHGKLATVTAVKPPGRFGALDCKGDRVCGFAEKPAGDGGRINGGFFVLSPKLLPQYLTGGDSCVWEQEPLANLAKDGQLMAWEHNGFWQPMDTLRDKRELERLWQAGAPWKKW